MSADVQAYEIAIEAGAADIDELGHVNNVVWVQWIQDAAVAHWRALASPAAQAAIAWVVVRHEIDYRRPAFAGDRIVGRTWVGAATRVKFERHTEFLRASDGVSLVKARTVWCPIDTATGRPAHVTDEVRASFSVDLPEIVRE